MLEFKAGFKHEMSFNKAAENSVAETLTWGVDSTIDVPANCMTTAELVVEEMSYAGSFTMNTRMLGERVNISHSLPLTLTGRVTISLHRRRDNALILAMTGQMAEIIKELLAKPTASKDFKV